MTRLSVAETAERLGVSIGRVHQRIQDGTLAAERIGSQWSVEALDVERLRRTASGPGRPLSSRSAWALAWAALDDALDDALDVSAGSAPERSRARRRLLDLLTLDDEHLDVSAVERALRNRARRETLRCSPRDLDDLRRDQRVYPSGVSLPDSNLSAADLVEGYVREADRDAVVEGYLLSPAADGRPNVVLHVLPAEMDATAPSTVDRLVRSLLVQVADLAEHGGAREKAEGLRLLGVLRDGAEEKRL